MASRSPSPQVRRSPKSPRSPARRSRTPPRRGRGSEREKRNSKTLFIGNLPYHFRERDVAEYFDRCGRIRNVTVGINRRTGHSGGYAFVEYEDRHDAEDAYDRFHGYNLEGRRLRLDWDIGIEKKEIIMVEVDEDLLFIDVLVVLSIGEVGVLAVQDLLVEVQEVHDDLALR